MSSPAWMITAGLLNATGTEGTYVLSPLTYEGDFQRPPFVEWSIELPVPPFPAATHTELGQPVLHGERIFVGAASEDALLILNRRDGSLLGRMEAAGPVQAAPILSEGRIWFSDSAGTTWCYPIEGGEPLWSHYSGAPILSSPTRHDDRIFVANVDNLVFALNVDTGQLVWRHSQRQDASRESELALYGAPSPVIADDLVLTGHSDGTLVALDANTGDLSWQQRIGEGRYPDIIAAPLVYEDLVILSGFTEPLLAMELETHNVLWRQEFGGAVRPTRDGDVLYHGGVDGVLRAMDLMTGSIRWEWDSETNSALGTPTLTEAGLLVTASGGGLSLVDPETGEDLWSLELGMVLSGISVQPAIDGRQAIVLTNTGTLLSLTAPSP